MRFNITDYFDYYRLDATAYSIEIYQKPLTERDFLVIAEKMKYYCRKDGASWLAVYSTTDSKDAEQAVERTGKRGRPRKIVQGTKIDGHIHNIIVGTAEKSAYSTAHAIKKSIDKKYKKPACRVVSKGNNAHAYNDMCYCLRQADVVRTGGDFDFAEYIAEHDFFS